jgi:prevent-host-death family protein
MSEVSAYDAKTHFSEYLARAKDGEEFLITHRGRPVARLVPLAPTRNVEEARAAMKRIRDRATELKLNVTHEEIRDMINEGRR